MKNKWIFGLVILALTVVLVGYNIGSNEKSQGEIYLPKNISNTLTPQERGYLHEKKEIIVGISDQCAPLEKLVMGFIDMALREVGQKGSYIVLPLEQLEAGVLEGTLDGAVMVYDKDKKQSLSFTNPILPTKGKLAVYEGDSSATSEKLQIINTENMSSVEEAVSDLLTGKIKNEKGMTIALSGHEPALRHYIKQAGAENEFAFKGGYTFDENFCIAVNKKDAVFYEILNKAVYELDHNRALSQLSGEMMGISYPLVEISLVASTGILLTIILVSVMAAFYIFYGNNKTLYEELASRMNQVLESQNELQTAFDGVTYAMVEMDIEGRILNVNKAFVDFVETGHSAVKGKNLTQVLSFDAEKEEAIRTLIDGSIESGEENKLEILFRRKFYNIRVFPLANSRERIVKILLTMQDVTKDKIAERQMLQENKMAAVGQLAAGVAHEIRNPLGLIRNYCYVLKTSDDQKEKAISVIEKAVENSGKIIDNLLNFSKSADHQWTKVELLPHINSILSLQKNRAAKENVTLEIQCDTGLTANVLTESLDMILINLTANALDAMESQSSETKKKLISVDCKEADSCVIIKIRDTGEGIPEEIIEEIFNPFFTTKEKRNGNGLGLYIVYNEIQKMNGKISVESQRGIGTEFTVKIPRMEV